MSKETVEVPMIKHESIISIDISGLFYSRIQDAYSNFAESITIEKTIDLIKHIKNEDFKSLSEEDLKNAVQIETFLILIATIEKEFDNKKLIYQEKIELPNED